MLVLNRRTATSRVVEPSTLGYASFLDVETTGFSPRADEIVELAIVLFEFNYADGTITEVVDSYSGLREPSVPIHPGASRVHGLTIDDLRGECLHRRPSGRVPRCGEGQSLDGSDRVPHCPQRFI